MADRPERRAWAALAAALAAGAAAGCSDPPPEPAPAPPQVEPAGSTTPAPGPRDSAGHPEETAAGSAPTGAPCRAGPLGRVEASAPSVAVAGGAGGGLLAWPASSTTLQVQPLDGSGRPRGAPSEVEHSGAGSLVALAVLDRSGGGGESAVAVSEAPCPGTDEAHRCLMARAIDLDGRPLGDERAVDIGAGASTLRRAISRTALHLAHGRDDAPPVLLRLRVARSGVRAESTPLGAGPAEGRVELLGATAEGDRWAVLWRRGAPEDAASRVMLATPRGARPIEPLHEALAVDSMAFDGHDVALVVSLELHRPHLFRIARDGSLAAAPVELVAGQALPSPFAERRAAVALARPSGPVVRVVDGAGDPVADVPLGGGGPSAVDVTRWGDAFVVARARRGGSSIELTRVSCEPATTAP